MFSHVELEFMDEVAVVRLNRPDKHNSIDGELLLELINCAKLLLNEQDIRAVILTGNGPSFCSGMDLKGIMSGSLLKKLMAILPLWKPSTNRYQAVSLVWRDLSVPVIAAIHGNCFGAGLQIALGADIRIASPQAKLSVMESSWGLVPDMGGTVTMRELIPKDVAMELTLTGRVLEAQQAQELGLVTHIAEPPFEAAMQICREIKQQSPDAVAAGKRLLHGAWNVSASNALSLERLWQRRVIGKRNQQIAVERRIKKSQRSYFKRTW